MVPSRGAAVFTGACSAWVACAFARPAARQRPNRNRIERRYIGRPGRDAGKMPRKQTRGQGLLPTPRGEVMEAQGIEPWSEPASSTASTCVGRCSRVVPGRSSANLPETNLQKSHPPPWRTAAGQPGFAIRCRRPRRASTPKATSASEAQLRQPAPNQSWQLNVSKRFYQEPGPGHAATPSTDPSKPVAP
jgi:hypothetical protein